MLSALYECYNRLLNDPVSDVAPPGYSVAKVSHALVLSSEGELVSVVPLGSERTGRVVTMPMLVPDQPGRSGITPPPYFLCDNSTYLLGLQVDGSTSGERLVASRALHEHILSGVDDAGAQSVLRFLANWSPESGADYLRSRCESDIPTGGNLVFRLEGDGAYIHQRPDVRAAWDRHQSTLAGSEESTGQCLITGQRERIARLHKSIKGVRGAAPTGASLVSFNFAAAESYGKEQGSNSPVSEVAAFGYVTALNYLLSTPRHRFDLNDTTVVAWAERAGVEEDLCLAAFADASGRFEPQQDDDEAVTLDYLSSEQVKSIISRVRDGKSLDENMVRFDAGVRIYILGLSANRSRLSVRFWYVDTLGTFIDRLRQHYEDLSIIRADWEETPPARQLLLETTPLVDRKRDKVQPGLEAGLMRAILLGVGYPRSLYTTMLARMRSDNEAGKTRGAKISHSRAAFVKAFLARQARIAGRPALKEGATYMLDEENRNPAYRLGRLFALMEKAQKDANPGINATIKDRYYASASSSPASVFPTLLRLTQHHISKSEYGYSVDSRIESVMQGLSEFPKHLNLDEQGRFVLGYYHQRQALYTRKEAGGATVD